jgi:4-hydroxy-tetrahydrodipicolinate synthase
MKTPVLALRGVVPILATPFADDETLDLESLERLVQFMVDIGVDGVTVLGVLGEANRLNDREREAVVDTAVKAARGRVPVVVGASHAGTHATVDLVAMAADLGAAAVMIAPTAEAVPSDERVFAYYRDVGNRSRIPIVLQDHPASTGVHMPVPLMLRIVAEVPAVAAIKEEAVPTAPRIRALRAGMSQRPVGILTGLGALYGLFDLEAGSDGFNTGFAFPEVLIAMVRAARAGDWSAVRALYARFLPLIVFEQQPGVAVRKEILRRRGLLRSGAVRLPGAPLPAGASTQLDTLLHATFGDTDLTRPIDPSHA